MTEHNLVEIIGRARTMRQVHNRLKGYELFIFSNFGGSSYTPLVSRGRFVIFEECDGTRTQYVQDRESGVAYSICAKRREEPEP